MKEWKFQIISTEKRLTSSTGLTWNNFLLWLFSLPSFFWYPRQTDFGSLRLPHSTSIFSSSSDSHKSWHEVNKRNSVHGQGKVEGSFCVFYEIPTNVCFHFPCLWTGRHTNHASWLVSHLQLLETNYYPRFLAHLQWSFRWDWRLQCFEDCYLSLG